MSAPPLPVEFTNQINEVQALLAVAIIAYRERPGMKEAHMVRQRWLDAAQRAWVRYSAISTSAHTNRLSRITSMHRSTEYPTMQRI